jgi:uncharacterized membrane protein
MYLLSLQHVQLNLDANAYTQLRQLTDASMRSNFKYVVYAALLMNLLLVLVNGKTPSSWAFMTALIAFIALVVDTLLTLKGNLPINDMINTWTVDHYPANWADYRSQWFRIFHYRQVANIIGFVSLLVGAVFGYK